MMYTILVEPQPKPPEGFISAIGQQPLWRLSNAYRRGAEESHRFLLDDLSKVWVCHVNIYRRKAIRTKPHVGRLVRRHPAVYILGGGVFLPPVVPNPQAVRQALPRHLAHLRLWDLA